jgi:hypothetical protein
VVNKIEEVFFEIKNKILRIGKDKTKNKEWVSLGTLKTNVV